MGKQLIPPDEHGDVQEIALREALEERYLAYALSTIMHRALPDARDGLKPVHRRRRKRAERTRLLQRSRLAEQSQRRKANHFSRKRSGATPAALTYITGGANGRAFGRTKPAEKTE